MGEPSSGALTMLQILKIINHNPTWHNYIEASKVAFADRNYFMGDPDYINSPGKNLLDQKYISDRGSNFILNVHCPSNGREKLNHLCELAYPGSLTDRMKNNVVINEELFGEVLGVEDWVFENDLSEVKTREELPPKIKRL